MIREIIRQLLGKAEPEECRVGWAYSESHPRNCTNEAVIRTTTVIGDGTDEYRSLYCEEHGSWPFTDRSRWLSDATFVETLDGGQWVEWTDYPIRTPSEDRTISESVEKSIEG